MAQPRSIKEAQEQEGPVASIQVLGVRVLSLEVVSAVSEGKVDLEQSSISKTSSVPLAVRQEAQDEDDEVVGRSKKRFWSERILKCRRTSLSWMLRRECRRISLSRRLCSVRLVLDLV